MHKVNDCKLIKIPTITDPRGNLGVLEHGVFPYDFKRVYYLFDVPSGAFRGGHSHKEQEEFLIALSGSFEVTLQDKAGNKKTVMLNKPNEGLLITTNIWRELSNFSSGSVCLVLSSDTFDETDYIRDYTVFMK